MTKRARRKGKKNGITYIHEIERSVCRHEEHMKCLRCGAIEFTIGLATGIVLTAIVIYYVL